MPFDTEHFENATQELDFYRCLTAEHLAEEAAYFEALFTQMDLEEQDIAAE